MRKKFLYFITALFLVFCAFAYAGTVKEYSADMVVVGSDTINGKLFVSNDKIRMESKSNKGNEDDSITIVRVDKGKAYALIPADKSYMEFDIKKGEDFRMEEIANGMLPGKFSVKRDKKGTETVNGYKTTKYEINTTVEMMGQKMERKAFEWIAAEFEPMPVRTLDVKDNITVEMRNIKKGAQNASLFEIPAGYEKAPDINDILKGIGQSN